MKKLLLAIVISLATSFAAKAQTPQLNKQQTLDYLSKLYRSSYDDAESQITSFLVEGKILSYKTSSGVAKRFDLATIGPLEVKSYESEKGLIYEVIPQTTSSIKYIFTYISLESDAIRLKKALEHLIELVKAEKSTDPFDN